MQTKSSTGKSNIMGRLVDEMVTNVSGQFRGVDSPSEHTKEHTEEQTLGRTDGRTDKRTHSQSGKRTHRRTVRRTLRRTICKAGFLRNSRFDYVGQVRSSFCSFYGKTKRRPGFYDP